MRARSLLTCCVIPATLLLGGCGGEGVGGVAAGLRLTASGYARTVSMLLQE